uniref:RNase H type-1 domain-containing protein n=1 Tax=Cannabis sativa TaxID=3483 RepID=A0A803QJC8_CANSA
MFLPPVTVTFSPDDLDFEIMAQKARKSKTPQDPTVTFKAELIESKIKSIGPYVGDGVRSCGIRNEQGCRIRSVAKKEFNCYPPKCLVRDKGCSTSEPSRLGTLSLEHIRAGAVLPLKDYFKEFCNYLVITKRPVPTLEIEKRHKILLGLPYGIASQYGTNFDRAGSSDWDLSPLNSFDLFMITGSRKFSNLYSSSSSSDDSAPPVPPSKPRSTQLQQRLSQGINADEIFLYASLTVDAIWRLRNDKTCLKIDELKAPNRIWIKLNCDVRVGLDCMCAAVVARDHLGRTIWVQTSFLEYVDALCGEAVACCVALDTARNRGDKFIIVESDSRVVINALNREIDNHVSFCLQSSSYFAGCIFSNISRNCNYAAHNVAKWAFNHKRSGFILISSIPEHLFCNDHEV